MLRILALRIVKMEGKKVALPHHTYIWHNGELCVTVVLRISLVPPPETRTTGSSSAHYHRIGVICMKINGQCAIKDSLISIIRCSTSMPYGYTDRFLVWKIDCRFIIQCNQYIKRAPVQKITILSQCLLLQAVQPLVQNTHGSDSSSTTILYQMALNGIIRKVGQNLNALMPEFKAGHLLKLP